MTYFGEFCYLNSSWIRKSITLMFMSSSRNKFTLLYPNSVTNVFVGFRPPRWCPSRWSPAWCLHTRNLYKFGRNISSDISVYGIFFWPESWPGTWYIYLLSFPRFRTLSIEWFWFWFWSILNGMTLKTSNTTYNTNFNDAP